MNGEINIENMIGTNIQLFCGICKKYDCLLHGIKDFSSLAGIQKPENFESDMMPLKPCGPNCYLNSTTNLSDEEKKLLESFENILIPEEEEEHKENQEINISEILSPIEISLLDKVFFQ